MWTRKQDAKSKALIKLVKKWFSARQLDFMWVSRRWSNTVDQGAAWKIVKQRISARKNYSCYYS